MDIKAQFDQWVEGVKSSTGSYPSKQEQKNKILELKRVGAETYTPEKNVQKAISIAESKGEQDQVALLKAMQEGRLGQEASSQGIKSLPYDERYVSKINGKPVSANDARRMEAIAPRTMNEMQQGRNFSPLSNIKDAMSLPFRAYESGVQQMLPKSPTFMDRMAQTEGTGFVNDAIRSPYNMIPLPKVPSPIIDGSASLLQKAIMMGREGIVNSIPNAALEQATNIESGKGLSPIEFGSEIITGGFLPVGTKAIAKTTVPLSEFTKDIMSEASGRTKKLLETIGGKEFIQGVKNITSWKKPKENEVLKNLESFSDNAVEIAGEILDKIDNFDVIYAEKNDIVKRALTEMKDMNAYPLIKKLEASKYDVPKNTKGFSDEVAFNDQVDGLINRIQTKVNDYNPELKMMADVTNEFGNPVYNPMTGSLKQRLVSSRGSTIPASEMLTIRRDIDKTINWNKDTFSKDAYSKIQDFKKNVRTDIKNELEKNAESVGNTEYAKAMREYFRVISLQDKAKNKLIPKVNDLGEVDKVTNFLLQSSNPNKIDQRLFIKDLTPILGTDLMDKGLFLTLSKEYRGALPIANDIATGRKNWLQGFMETTGGKVATFPFSSPKIAAPITGAIDYTMNNGGLYSPLMNQLMKSGTTESIGE